MDPSIFEKLNALQNMQRQRQAAEQHEEQARLNQNLQSELLAIKRQIKRQLEVEENKPKCPHCGGGAEIGYNVCKNCAREVIWVGNLIGLPGQEEQLNELHATLVEEEKRKPEREEFKRQEFFRQCKIRHEERQKAKAKADAQTKAKADAQTKAKADAQTGCVWSLAAWFFLVGTLSALVS